MIETEGQIASSSHKSLLFWKIPPASPAFTTIAPATFSLKSLVGQAEAPFIIKLPSALNQPAISGVETVLASPIEVST